MAAGTQRPATNSRYRYTTPYVDGNTVRAAGMQAVPQRGRAVRASVPAVPQPARPARPKRRVRYQEAVRTESISITLPSTLMLLAAVIASLVIGYNYLRLKSSLDVHLNSIKTLETQLDRLRTENDALERSIDTSVDLNKVYDVAVNQLGMVRVGQSNIIQYDKTESEFVRQYENLPDAD